ncbi:MAG: hypothetical protein LBC97_02175 [Bifidobacteriaceae bacterium]|nr:hypothetical protein [Bifidobacteriaceae bacterium]
MTVSKYKPLRRGSLIWRYTRLVFACAPAVARVVLKDQPVPDEDRLAQRESIELFRRSLFEEPACDLRARRNILGLLAAIPMLLFVVVLLTMFGFLLTGVATGNDGLVDASGWILSTGVVYSLGLMCQFCFRMFFAELDLKRYERDGGRGVAVPSGLSQPKSRDFFYPLPFTLYMVAMMLIAQARP